MKRSLLDYLVCPVCKSDLRLNGKSEKDGEIIDGSLACVGCDEVFPIDRGVPVLLPRSTSHQSLKSVEGFGFEWTAPELRTEIDEDIYSRELQFSEFSMRDDWFPGKIVFEPGCGNGRKTKFFRNLSCVVIAMDLSESVFEAYRRLGNHESMHFLRGDMALPPFRDGQFDMIYASAVLQHTMDPEKTIQNLVKRLKIGGHFVGGLYMTPEKWTTWAKVKIIGAIRTIFKFIPRKAVYYYSWLSIPCYRYKILYPIARILFIKYPHTDNPKYTWVLNYDQYIPDAYQPTFTREDTKRYLISAGLGDLRESNVWANSYRATRER